LISTKFALKLNESDKAVSFDLQTGLIMAKSGPIIIVEDDPDDQELIESAIRNGGIANKILFFADGETAFAYLKAAPEQPFLILSDVNMPRLNGIEFKRKIDEDSKLREKSIPFVFFTTSTNQESVTEAYTKMTVQGFFTKSYSLEELNSTIKLIMDYWKICRHPHSDY
jgi:CheY-like chemotaxis protein